MHTIQYKLIKIEKFSTTIGNEINIIIEVI